MRTQRKQRFVISVLVADRVGILRDITAALTDMDANIDGISQTVVEGYFTVILTATFDRAADCDEIHRALATRFGAAEASVAVRPFGRVAVRKPTVAGERYVVTLSGPDAKGILKGITAHLAERGVNVEDWYVHFDGARVTHVGEVTVPGLLDIQQVQKELQELMRPFGHRVSVQHENIFRATNDIGPVRALVVRP